MSTLEQLRPFVSICQACGVFPYTMDYDPVTQRFRGFAFSFKNFTTWWFVLLLVSQITLPFFLGNFLKDISISLLTDRTLPFVVNVMITVLTLSSFIQLGASRWIFFFRFRQLRKVVKAMLHIERLLFADTFNSVQFKNSFSKHFVIGFIMLITVVSR